MRLAGRSTRGPALIRRGADIVAGTPAALSRQRVGTALKTGVRVIDIFTPLCFGQRLGIFAGSGVGKSTLLAMLAAADAFDTVVVALVGERGREVREFLEDTIGHKNMAKTVAVVATSDESAMMRKRAPGTAMRVAEHFRDRGDRVLLVLDSITRFAHALREVATGSGEHAGGARLSGLGVHRPAEAARARRARAIGGKGSITAVISVLVDGDDHNDPVADSVRGILDGHVVLDRAIAEQGRYPPVNPLSSISRLATKAWSDDERAAGDQAELDDRALRGHARHPPARRLSGRRRRRARPRGAPGAADLRGAAAVAQGPALLRPVRRPGASSEEQGEAAWRGSERRKDPFAHEMDRFHVAATSRGRRSAAAHGRRHLQGPPDGRARHSRATCHRRARHHARPASARCFPGTSSSTRNSSACAP